MVAEVGEGGLQEKQMFHGTSSNPAIVNSICQSNFDWRRCGTHGTAYGQGQI